MVKSLVITSSLFFLAISGVFAKPNLTVKVDNEEIVFNAQEGYAIENVVSGKKVIKTFNLSIDAPKTVVKRLNENYEIVSTNAEPSISRTRKKEMVFFKGLESVVVDLNTFEASGYFSSSEFGMGKVYEFEISTRRVSKLMGGDKLLVGNPNELPLGVVVRVHDKKKIITVWYLYKPDGRIKEVFFQQNNKIWTRIKQKVATEALHSIDPNFSPDYKTIHDGVSFTFVAVMFAVFY